MSAAAAGRAEIQSLGRYEILARIASGGMGTVYLGRLGGPGRFERLYAIKQLHPHLADEPAFVDMFLDEARLAARIRHPNVVSILEIDEDQGSYFLVMDYVEGATPAELIPAAVKQKGQIPPGVSIRIVLDALAGLHAAHELVDENGRKEGLVHRDVSPHNILVGVDGLSRLTDFGVARANARITKTRAGELKGKLPYMSPEQANGEELDRRSDVFSMGIVLVEMFTSRRLFKSGSHMDTIRQLLLQPIPRLRDRMPDAPIELDLVCARALARDRKDRFATAADFACALENVARKLGLLATSRDVAASIQKLVGPMLASRAARIAEAQGEAVSAVVERPAPAARHTLLLENALVPYAETMSVPFAALASPPISARASSREPSMSTTSSSSIRRRSSPRSTVTVPLVLAAILAGSAGTLAIVDAQTSSRDPVVQPAPSEPVSAAPIVATAAPTTTSATFTAVPSTTAETKRVPAARPSTVGRHSSIAASPAKHNAELGPGPD